jgi:putative ABC transport system permease protein
MSRSAQSSWRCPSSLRPRPMIFNLMDLTPEVNALVLAGRPIPTSSIPSTLSPATAFTMASLKFCWATLLAGNLNKKVGDTLSIQGSPFTVPESITAARLSKPARSSCPRPDAAALQPARKSHRLSCAASPGATRRIAEHYLKRAQAQIEAALPGLRAVPAAERASNNQIVQDWPMPSPGAHPPSPC